MYIKKCELAVIVPAFNEEQVIGASLKALSQVIDPRHIYVVSDGSKDRTVEIAEQYTQNVLSLKKNYGKATALFALIEVFSLINHYEYLLFSDADSRLEPNFLDLVRPYLYDRPACIVGTVCSDRNGVISAYRTFEYGYGFHIIKRAQNSLRMITIAPGCASLYKSSILNRLNFSTRTLTEDFDLTLQIHIQGLGEIVYAPKAKVYTQDPGNLHDYWRQVVRWNTGYWQNTFIHKLLLPNKRISYEIWLSLIDSLSWITSIVVLIISPLYFGYLLLATYIVTVLLAFTILASLRQWWAVKYIPLFLIFQLMSFCSYAYAFFLAVRKDHSQLSWNKVARAAIKENNA